MARMDLALAVPGCGTSFSDAVAHGLRRVDAGQLGATAVHHNVVGEFLKHLGKKYGLTVAKECAGVFVVPAGQAALIPDGYVAQGTNGIYFDLSIAHHLQQANTADNHLRDRERVKTQKYKDFRPAGSEFFPLVMDFTGRLGIESAKFLRVVASWCAELDPFVAGAGEDEVKRAEARAHRELLGFLRASHARNITQRYRECWARAWEEEQLASGRVGLPVLAV